MADGRGMIHAAQPNMQVDELMTRDVASCAPTDSLNIAAEIMWRRDCGCVPVVGKDLVPVGIVADRDACMGAYTRGQSLHAIQVQDVMAKPVLSCLPDDDLVTVERLMRDNQVRRLPVCDQAGKLVGIISLSDLARANSRKAPGGKRSRVTRSGDIADVLAALSEPRSHAMATVSFAPEPGEAESRPKSPIKRGHARR